jgi:hypothetical protein
VDRAGIFCLCWIQIDAGFGLLVWNIWMEQKSNGLENGIEQRGRNFWKELDGDGVEWADIWMQLVWNI